jgi:hypothetical protein
MIGSPRLMPLKELADSCFPKHAAGTRLLVEQNAFDIRHGLSAEPHIDWHGKAVLWFVEGSRREPRTGNCPQNAFALTQC